MKIKERTRNGLEERIEDLEGIIAQKGVGARYLQRIKRIQRNVNIALLISVASATVGITAWIMSKSEEEE